MNTELYNWLYSQTRAGAPRSPERMTELLRVLGLEQPENVVLITGTNGKGTIAKALSFALMHAGYRTGVFISPHVERFTERITVNGREVPELTIDYGIMALQHRQPTFAHISPNFFELALAMAVSHFSTELADYAVIEAGVGVQYDATNALTNVVASVISNVSLDHMNVLGATVAEIAADKAHAIKPGVTTFSGVTDPEIEAVFTARAAQVGGTLVTVPPSDSAEVPHELRIAAAVARHLGLEPEDVQEVYNAPRLPARRERFMLTDDRTAILDGAHNVAAVERLISELPSDYTLLFAALPKKDGAALLERLWPASNTVFSTVADPREPSERYPRTAFFAKPEEALTRALRTVPPGGTLVIAGSFYLAGAVRQTLMKLQVAALQNFG